MWEVTFDAMDVVGLHGPYREIYYMFMPCHFHDFFFFESEANISGIRNASPIHYIYDPAFTVQQASLSACSEDADGGSDGQVASFGCCTLDVTFAFEINSLRATAGGLHADSCSV